ncbi:MAG: phosphodiesterase [Methylibium sp.]|uniref:HD-GYP domain-containing protein n=1 Tax=Methylibium sp. TaxID=2067992 RepID=UPI0017E6886F|nr:phosphodiesterase [Methylibium sp.]MBA3598139.1 phosphodiesterase [Methylibium sp.]
MLSVMLLDAEEDPLRIRRLQAFAEHVLLQAPHRQDETLFALFQRKSRMSERYSVEHSLSCALVANWVALQLDWTIDERRALVNAALTMNISITALQNELAHRERPLTIEQRQAVAGHARQSADFLRSWGVSNALWLKAVEAHHLPRERGLPLSSLEPSDRLTELLQRVDIFLAKLSPRAGRRALLTTVAARDAYIGSDGRPDEIGTATLRVLGLYPPGTWVKLASGEFAVVLCRGARADQPLVASVADPRRQPFEVPLVCRTDEPLSAVQAACRADEVRLTYGQELLWNLVTDQAPLAPPAETSAERDGGRASTPASPT